MACHDSDGGILACLPSVIPPSPFVPRILLSKMRGVLQGPRALFSHARGASEGCFPRALCSHASGALPRRRESIPWSLSMRCRGANQTDLAHVPPGVQLPADPISRATLCQSADAFAKPRILLWTRRCHESDGHDRSIGTRDRCPDSGARQCVSLD